MKIQINGFDIEINTEETNLTLKVLDANGKELSNNTYNQSDDVNGDPTPVEMPSAEETNDENPEGNEPPSEDGSQPVQGSGEETGLEGGEEVSEEELQEGLIPSYAQFKKINEAKKKSKEDITIKIKALFKSVNKKPGIGLEDFWNAVEDLEKSKDDEKKSVAKKLRSLGNQWEKLED